MTDIKRIAAEAGLAIPWISDKGLLKWSELERFASIVAAAEREACAAMVDPVDESLADEIRARGKK